jgi:hypothetical protein
MQEAVYVMGDERRIQATAGYGGGHGPARVPIAYRIEPVYGFSSGLVTASLLTSMISGKVINNSGGGGTNHITVEEYKVLKENQGIKNLIKAEAEKPVPTVIQVVVSMTDDAEYEGVITDLKAEGFHLLKRGVLGTTAFLVGEMYDTYLERARNVDGVETIQLKEDINF